MYEKRVEIKVTQKHIILMDGVNYSDKLNFRTYYILRNFLFTYTVKLLAYQDTYKLYIFF